MSKAVINFEVEVLIKKKKEKKKKRKKKTLEVEEQNMCFFIHVFIQKEKVYQLVQISDKNGCS